MAENGNHDDTPDGRADRASNAYTIDARSLMRERRVTRAGILFTLLASAFAALDLSRLWVEQAQAAHWGALGGHTLFTLIVAFLVYGGLVYQFTRLAYLNRRLEHRPVGRAELESFYDGDAPALTILVPSYREDEEVVTKTLLSAAFQDYPNRRVVLLVDDPPRPGNAADAAALAAARSLPARLQSRLTAPARRFAGELTAFQVRSNARRPPDPRREARRLAALHRLAAAWFDEQIRACPGSDHVDALFVEKVLAAHRDDLGARAETLLGPVRLDGAQLLRQYRRLAALFDVEITSFERKRYVNLSHEPNKAMNLNSYIALVGKRWRERLAPGGLHLVEADSGEAALDVPDTDYFITLDADSILVPDYAARLIHLTQQPEHAGTAVAQTPYSAIPNAPGALERIAGATTDIQYIIHQGFTGYDATYWVGANALLRKAALADIAVVELERGFPVTRYIQDRTVIEDTESSVDLVERGWRLYNYPERMAFSATPPDFGSLLIQRRRWANGGLIILPKLLRYLAGGRARSGEGWMRFHYLSSIAMVNIGLLILLAVPFTESATSLWIPLTSVPYFLLYARDLRLIGYRASDVLRVYALNLLLIPVNVGGVLKSLQQAWTKEKIPFGRTPKVAGRTAAAPLYLLSAYGLLALWLAGAGVDFATGRPAHGLFALLNTLFLGYAVLRFVGLRESGEDLLAGLRARFGGIRAVAANDRTAESEPVSSEGTMTRNMADFMRKTAPRPLPRGARAGESYPGAEGSAGPIERRLSRNDRFFWECRPHGEPAANGWFFHVRDGDPIGPFSTRGEARIACDEYVASRSDMAALTA